VARSVACGAALPAAEPDGPAQAAAERDGLGLGL